MSYERKKSAVGRRLKMWHAPVLNKPFPHIPVFILSLGG